MDECDVIFTKHYDGNLLEYYRKAPPLIPILKTGISEKVDRFIEAAIRHSVERALDGGRCFILRWIDAEGY